MSLDSLPSTMRAVGINQYGDINAIEQLELPLPKLKPNEILVKVRLEYFNRIIKNSYIFADICRSNMEVATGLTLLSAAGPSRPPSCSCNLRNPSGRRRQEQLLRYRQTRVFWAMRTTKRADSALVARLQL